MTHSGVDSTDVDDAIRARLRRLPSVQAVTEFPEIRESADGVSDEYLVGIVRECIDAVRKAVISGQTIEDPAREVRERATNAIHALNRSRLSEVINATGVVIHTNLGRAPVSREAAEATSLAASRYTPLELEIESGKRGGRMSEISRLLRLLTGAEDSLVVNNNAAAVLLVLSALCSGREVVLSRSQAVEIGGGFRIPDVLAQSGARLVEVGTTNRTYARDFANAITEETAAILTVHWSNFRIIGFTEQPTLTELSEVAKSRELPLIEDLGSGSLLETTPYGLSHEPTVTESLAAGVDVVCFSGDKLLGGPQAGIISGTRELVQKIAKHPLARAVRADKTALAGIAATLRHYVRGEATSEIPVWRMISADNESLRRRCEGWREHLADIEGLEVVQTDSAVGGGSLPGETLSSWALAIRGTGTTGVEELARRLRTGLPAIMPRVEDDRLLLDARTVLPDQDEALVDGLSAAMR